MEKDRYVKGVRFSSGKYERGTIYVIPFFYINRFFLECHI